MNNFSSFFIKKYREKYNKLFRLVRVYQWYMCTNGMCVPMVCVYQWYMYTNGTWVPMKKSFSLPFLLSLSPPSLSVSHPLYLSLTCYMLQWLVYSITLHTLYYTWLPLSWVRFEPMTLGCKAAALTNRPQRRSHSHIINLFYLCQ